MSREERLAEQVEGARQRDAGADEDFLYHLHRGGELLAAGKNLEARDELERAAHLRPRNQKAHNLLGLAYFKLGLFERAIDVYEKLVQDNPRDATLRVNLGLVHLKAGQMGEAIAQLEAAVELVPDHAKALNYLGLAYAQAKAPAQAKRIFERSGNTAMVRRIEAAMRGKPEAGDFELSPGVGNEHAPSQDEVSAESTDADPRFGPAPAEIPGLAKLVRTSSYDPPPAHPFHVDGRALVLGVSGELRTRLSQLLWMRGELARNNEVKRFRGRLTEQFFGEGEDRMFHLQGNGVVVLSPEGYRFVPVDLQDEAVYLVETSLFAFETSLGYENGRIPSDTPPDLSLVHLRGRGKALLRSPGPVWTVSVQSGEPLQLPVDRLVGWLGNLTPAVFEIQGAPGRARWVRLQGDGWALWSSAPTAQP
jgi:uncharacterized protein (AIM24 family)